MNAMTIIHARGHLLATNITSAKWHPDRKTLLKRGIVKALVTVEVECVMEVVIRLIAHLNPSDLNRNLDLPLDLRNPDTDLHLLSLIWKLTAKDTNLEAAARRGVEVAAKKEAGVVARREVAAASEAAAVALLESTKRTLLRLLSRTTPALNLLTRTCTLRAKDTAAAVEVAVNE